MLNYIKREMKGTKKKKKCVQLRKLCEMKSKHEIKWGKNISIYKFYARSTLMHHIVWVRVLGCGRHMGYVRAQQLIHIKHDQLFNVCYFINLRPNNCMCNCFEPLIHCCTNLCIVLYLYRWDEQGGLSFHVILNDRTWFTVICSHANFLGGLLCRRLFFSGWVCLRLPMCVFSLSFFGVHRVLYLRPQTYEYQTRPLSQQLLFSFDACTTFIIAKANPTALNGLNKMLADNTDTLRCWWVFFPCWYLDAMQILSMNMRTQAHT